MTQQMDTRTGMVSNINGVYLVPSDSNRDAVHGEAIMENLRQSRMKGEYDGLNDAAWDALMSHMEQWAKS